MFTYPICRQTVLLLNEAGAFLPSYEGGIYITTQSLGIKTFEVLNS